MTSLGATALACSVMMSRASAAREALSPSRAPLDESEVQAMRAAAPHAVDLLEQGEALATAGDFAKADAIFLQAQKEYAGGSLLLRRDCEAKTALGQRNDAIQACSRAIEATRSDPNVRALVHALIDGPHPPTASELSAALLVTAGEHHLAPERPTAAAAACDIAERLGDGAMLKRCAEELVRIAPDDPATERAMSLLSASCPPWRFWSGWLAILAVVVVTLGDAFRRLSRRRPKRSSVVAVALLIAALGSFASRTAFADESDAPEHGWLSKWAIDDKSPSSMIPSEADRNADPLQFGYWLQDVTWKGEHASRKGDHAAAAKYFGTLADAVPDRAIGFTLACNEYEALGDLDHAINSCGQALYRGGALVKDYAHFVELVLAKPGKLGKKETDKLAEVLAHMRQDPTGRGYADDLQCEVGVRTSNVTLLRECTANMAAVAPNNPKILSYEWNLAIQEGKFALAREILARAGAAGLPAETILRMQKLATTTERWHWIRVGLVVLALVLLLGGSGVAARTFRRRRGVSAGVGGPQVEKAVLAG